MAIGWQNSSFAGLSFVDFTDQLENSLVTIMKKRNPWWYLVWFLAFCFGWYIGPSAKADEGFMGFGVGVFNSAKNGYGEVKTYNLGARQDLIDGFYWQEKVGLWGIGSNPDGMKSSGYGSTGLGFRVDLAPVEFHAGWSLSGITTPDSYLGGYFQFNGDLGFALRDTKHGNGIGLSYGHISSAGIEMPNQGRDFLTLELSQRW